MEQDFQKHKDKSLTLCRRLLSELATNDDDMDSFFGGELRKLYLNVNEVAKNKVKSIQSKINNL